VRKFLFLTVIICVVFAGPAWANDTTTSAGANAGAVAGASATGANYNPVVVAQGGHGGRGGKAEAKAQAITGPSSASVKNVKTGDVGFKATVEAPVITQTWESANLWKQKGPAVLPGIASPNLMQQFVGGGVPLSVRQDRVFQAMMALFPMEYRVVTARVQGKSTLRSSKRFRKHWWSSKTEMRIPPVPFKTEIETEHAKISVALHPWYRNFLVEKNKTRVAIKSIKVVNTSLSGNFVPLGVIAVSSRDPGGSPLPLTDDVALYVQKYFKGVEKVVLFDPEIGRGAINGSEANSKGGGISTAIANFASFNTLTGGASVGGSAGTVMPVSVFGKCFLAMASADVVGVKGIKINLTNTLPKNGNGNGNGDNGDGKKAVGSGVVK